GTSADIAFQENGTATSWQYVISNNVTADPNTLTSVSATTNPIPLTGLSPLTQYSIWVRADCGTEQSVWSQLVFQTEAVPATIPYHCDWEDPTEYNNWRNIGATINKWTIGTAAVNGPTTTTTTD